MVSTNKYLNTRAKMFDLEDKIKATDKCNARLMAEGFELSSEIKKLTAEIGRLTGEIRKLESTVSAKEYVAQRMDYERRKAVESRRAIENRYNQLCGFVSSLELDDRRTTLCNRCRYQDDDGFSCNCPSGCVFSLEDEK